jgi:hypothetical protein
MWMATFLNTPSIADALAFVNVVCYARTRVMRMGRAGGAPRLHRSALMDGGVPSGP